MIIAKLTPDAVYKALTAAGTRHPATGAPPGDLRNAANYIGKN